MTIVYFHKPVPLPVEDWPLWARRLAKYRAPEDSGVGDTAQRQFAKLGGERYKDLMRWLGIPCKCESRQAEWNERYHYLAGEVPAERDISGC